MNAETLRLIRSQVLAGLKRKSRAKGFDLFKTPEGNFDHNLAADSVDAIIEKMDEQGKPISAAEILRLLALPTAEETKAAAEDAGVNAASDTVQTSSGDTASLSDIAGKEELTADPAARVSSTYTNFAKQRLNPMLQKAGLSPLSTEELDSLASDAAANEQLISAKLAELRDATAARLKESGLSKTEVAKKMGGADHSIKKVLAALYNQTDDATLQQRVVEFQRAIPHVPAAAPTATPNTAAGTAGAPTININTGKAAKAAEEMFDFGAGFKGTQAQARMLEALKHLGIEAPAKGFTKAEVMRLGPEILNRLTQIPGGAEAIQAHMASLSPEDLADPTKSMAALMEGVQTKIPGLEQEAQKAAETSAKKEAVSAAKKRLGSPEYRKMAKGQFVPDKASVLELLTSGEGLDLGKTKRLAQSQYLREGNTSGYEKLTPELQKTLDAELSQQVRKNKAKVSVPKELSAGFEKTALENELLASGAGPLKSLVARSGGLKGMGKAAGATALLALLFKGMSLYDEHKEENLADLQMQGRSTESMLEDLKAQRALQRQALAEAGAAGPQALQLLRSKLPPMTPSEVYIGPDPSGT